MKLRYCSLISLLLLIVYSSFAQAQDVIPKYDSIRLMSRELGELRTINVWLPEDYAHTGIAYPVLYMPDGGINEDFPHIAHTLTGLIASKRIPPFILVGIENTQRRRDLTGPTQVKKDKEIAPVTGGAAAFRAFIVKELFLAINKRYRTTGEKGIIGESLAGLFVMETLLLAPESFDFYIAMDPSLWWNNHHLIKTAKACLAKLPAGEKRLWFAGSGTRDISKHTKALAQTLQSLDIKNLTWQYADEPEEKHHTIYRATKEKALVWILNVK